MRPAGGRPLSVLLAGTLPVTGCAVGPNGQTGMEIFGRGLDAQPRGPGEAFSVHRASRRRAIPIG